MGYNNDYVSHEFEQAPLGAIRNGRFGEPVVIDAGGQKKIVDYTFTARPAVGDTLTVNGTVWTFIANGGAVVGNEIALGAATLADDLAAMIAALNGSAEASTTEFVYTDDGVSVLTATAKMDAPYPTAGFAESVAAGCTVTIVDEGYPATDLKTDTCNISLKMDAVTQAQSFTLPDGMEFEHRVLAATGTPGGDFVVTPANLVGGATITFAAAGEMAVLQFLAGAWHVLAGAATVA